MANINDPDINKLIHQTTQEFNDSTIDVNVEDTESVAKGDGSGPPSDKDQPEIKPYDRRWQPQLVHEGNPNAPFAGLWMVRVPLPSIEMKTKADGSTYQYIRTRYAVSYFENEALATEFAGETWRDAHAEGPNPIHPEDPDPTIQRTLRWRGPKTPEADAWLEEQSLAIRTNRVANTSVFVQYTDPQVAVKFRFVKPPSLEEDLQVMDDDTRYDKDTDIEEDSQLQFSQEERTTLYLQAHPQRGGFFLWQGVESRSRQPDALFDRAHPVAVVPVLFDTERQATTYAKELGYATVTPVSYGLMKVKSASTMDESARVPANPDILRKAKVPKSEWSAPVKALDLFNRVSQSSSLQTEPWHLPSHRWQTAPVTQGLETTWVVWRQRAGIGFSFSDFVRDPVEGQRARHYATLGAVQKDYPEVVRHPKASAKIERMASMHNLGSQFPDDDSSPRLHPTKALLKPIDGPDGTAWLETLIATDVNQQITWAASRVGQDIRRWNVGQENPYDGHTRLAEQYAMTGTIQEPKPADPAPSPVAAEPTKAPKAPVSESASTSATPGWRDRIDQPVARIAAIDSEHWGVYTVTQQGFREEHAWITSAPTVDRVVRPDPRIPESAKAPALAHVGRDLWIAVPKDYEPKAALTTWPSAEAAKTAAVQHDFTPESDSRQVTDIQRELRRAPFTTQDISPARATAYVAELDAGQYAAWLDTGAPNFRAWVMKAPKGHHAGPTLAMFSSPGEAAAELEQRGIHRVQPDMRPTREIARDLFSQSPMLRPGARVEQPKLEPSL